MSRPTPKPKIKTESAAGHLRLWRLVKTEHAATAFDGEGAFRYGGRWNSRGRRVVYASGSLSLALLEILVHLDPAAALPGLCAFTLDLPTEAILNDHFSSSEEISEGIPWPLGQTRGWGDAWCLGKKTPALRIPSAIVPNESNYLLNPSHPGFATMKIGEAQAFALDSRLGF